MMTMPRSEYERQLTLSTSRAAISRFVEVGKISLASALGMKMLDLASRLARNGKRFGAGYAMWVAMLSAF
jgi:hypothetical protein